MNFSSLKSNLIKGTTYHDPLKLYVELRIQIKSSLYVEINKFLKTIYNLNTMRMNVKSKMDNSIV